ARVLIDDSGIPDEAFVVGVGLASPRRLESAADDTERIDRLRKEQDFLGVAEGDGAVTNRRVFPHDHDVVVEVVPPLNPRRDSHAGRSADTSLNAQHVIALRIDPDASPRGDISRPVETVLVPLLVFDQFGVALPIDRGEVDADGGAVSLLRESRGLELILRTMSRE